MLVLSRKPGERLDIGDDVTIEVRRVAGDRVTLAIEAPKAVKIWRSELPRLPLLDDAAEADNLG